MLTKVFSKLRPKKTEFQNLLSRLWMSVEVPAAVREVPTMLSRRELQLLHWLSRHHANGSGRIVDAGCFLGGSTAALASGLAARSDGPWDKTIATYDLFRVEAYTLQSFTKYFTNPTIGASFRSDFDANIAPWSRHVEVHEGDAAASRWSGEPIEILFLDLVKTWGLNDFVLDQFLPRLVPGHSIIIQQDYLWGFAPWIHITMELLAPSVTILDSMPCSVVYLLTKPVPEQLVGAKVRELLSPEAQLELMDRAVNRWKGEQRGMVELARIILLAGFRPAATVRVALDDVLARYAKHAVVTNCGNQVGHCIAGREWWLR
jgi:hypothetical protein